MHRTEQMNFVAVDFETANHARASVCQAGIAVVRNGVVEDVQEWFVQPPTGMDSFHPKNVQLHRITPRVAADGLLWEESAERLGALVGDLPVIAHNAEFDRGVYLSACETLQITPFAWRWYCSQVISQNHLRLPKHSLKGVAAHFAIDLGDHHRAGSDARVAAEIVLAISQSSGTSRLHDLGLELPAPNRNHPRRSNETSARSFIPAHTISRYTRVSDLPKANPSADPRHPLHAEHVVLSGEVGEYDRDHWIDRLAEVGAQPQLNITKKTTLVAIGAKAGKAKAADAEKRRSAGQPIQVVTSEWLVCLLEGVQDVDAPDGLDEGTNGLGLAETATEVRPLPAEDRELPRVKSWSAEQSEPLGAPSQPQPTASNPIQAQLPASTAPDGYHDANVFQRWDGPPGSLPEGWTLSLQHRGRPRRITTTRLNRNPTGTPKRIGAAIGIILGSLIAAAILTPLLGPLAPLIFIAGIIYGIAFTIRSVRTNKLRWQFWANRPEPRQVLLAHKQST